MRIPLSWLKDYVDIPISPAELAERLTLAGLEVETIEYVGLPGATLPWDPEKIVVGELRAVHYHPNADRLVLAEVEYGGPGAERPSWPAPPACWRCEARVTCTSRWPLLCRARVSTTATLRECGS